MAVAHEENDRDLWSVYVDTLLQYRNLGLGKHIAKELTLELEKDGKVVFYTT